MKTFRRFFSTIIFSLFFASFAFCAENVELAEKSIVFKNLNIFVSDFVVWTFDKGVISFGEYIGLLQQGEPFSISEYEPSSDNSKWIKPLFLENKVFAVSAPEIYEEISSLIENSDIGENLDSNTEDSEIEKIAQAISNESANAENSKSETEQKYLDEYENLAFYSYGEESLSVQNYENKKVISRSDKKNAVRFFYDDKMRLLKKENWDISGGFSSAKNKEVQEFYYSDENIAKPEKSVITSETEKHEILYDLSGKIVESKNFEFYKDDENAQNNQNQNEKIEKNEKKSLFIGKTTWKYSDSGKILEKYSEEYEYNAKKTKITKTFSKKEVYEYKIQDGNPDYYYYENNVLRMSTVYSSLDSYLQTMNFDNNFVVESYFENGKRKKELLYLNGRLRSEKSYEQ